MPVAGFVSRADKALYAAKETGRNKVCTYEAIT
jgi:PleD family two-component response regulator